MAITKSAKKAIRVSARKKVFNIRIKNSIDRELKKLKKLLQEGKKAEALKQFSFVQKSLDKSAKKGVIKKNTASRKKSRIVSMIKKIS